MGCRDLANAIEERPSLKAIIFGHVHHSYGARKLNDTWFINAAQYNYIHEQNKGNILIELKVGRDDKQVHQIVPH